MMQNMRLPSPGFVMLPMRGCKSGIANPGNFDGAIGEFSAESGHGVEGSDF